MMKYEADSSNFENILTRERVEKKMYTCSARQSHWLRKIGTIVAQKDMYIVHWNDIWSTRELRWQARSTNLDNILIFSSSYSKQFGTTANNVNTKSFLFFPTLRVSSSRDISFNVCSECELGQISFEATSAPIFLGQWLCRAGEWQLTEIEFGRQK